MHKTFWFKIHWFLGFVFGVLLLIVGLSGAILSYEKEIMNIINKDTYKVEVPQNQKRLSEVELLKIFHEKNPDTKINSISFSSDITNSVYINVVKEGQRRGFNHYIDPYTAQELPQIKGKDFFMFVFRLHRWLAFEGTIQALGKQAVALATIAAIFLTIGGVIVYWPRVKNRFLKSFTFSFKHKNRAFLSSMHGALGMWVVPFFLLMCFTGLYWSYDWYRSAMYTVLQVEQAKRMAPPKASNKAQELNFENIEISTEIFKNSVARDFKNASLRVKPNKDELYTLTYLYEDATHFRESNSMQIDVKNRKVVEESKYEDKKLNEKIMTSILPLHSGEFFGWIGKLIYFISSALMALFVITGYMLYFDRKKKKRAKTLKK